MNFTAPAFVLLFPIVLALHWMLPPSRRWGLLLAASLGFYAVGSPQALPLLAGITLGTYAAALGIAKSKTQTAKKLWLTCAAVLCIGCLCLFKYAGIFRTDVPLLLPAGISFYTFQTLSYVIDIYRGRLMPERHPGYYALFVSFFPQLVAGPIERSTALLPQLHAQERRMDSSGWLWMVRGFAKKLLLADTAAVFVDSVYASPTDASGPAVLLATLLFAGQIYWDFSGYSDIAVGAAALLGVRLSRNFDHPYRADSLRDFWRRWHISLTRWFTDYVYIPLGGSRKGTLRMYLNQMIAMVACGLWHGASLSFIVWGALHGALVCLHKFFSQTVLHHDRHYHPRGWRRFVAVFVTFHVVCLTWLLFRNATFEGTWVMLEQMFTKFNPDVLPEVLLTYKYVFALMIFALVSHWIPDSWQDQLIKVFAKGGVALAAVAIAVVIFVIMQVKGSEVQPFIYFQF